MKLSLPPLLLLLTLLNTSALAAPGHGAPPESPSLSAPFASVAERHGGRELAMAPVEQFAVDGHTLSRQLAKLTGVAISPLLGMGLLGASAYFQAPAETRAGLPWHLQPWAWGPALLLVLCVALKDSLLALPGLGVLKKPLDAAEVVENKVSGAVAMPLVTKGTAAALTLPLAGAVAGVAQLILPTAHAAGPAGAALGGIVTAAFYGVALVLAAGAFALVWLTSHAVNVLVLLSPLALVGTALKLARLVLLGFPVLCAAISPTLGLLVCAAYLALAWWLAGWAFRLLVFGGVFSVDFLLLRWRRQKVDAPTVRAFAAELEGVPARTYGTLTRTEAGAVDFTFRPWLVLPARTVRVAGSVVGLEVEKGLISPMVVLVEPSRQVRALIRLPPRYRKLEFAVAGVFGALPLHEAALVRGLVGGWQWLKSQFSRTRRRGREVRLSQSAAS
ncbi:hypothetical protein [Vitiosangium sp. GDMCC 1.1324]|uniref:hypothetical protein n=1 Tax=Vitiosangium sp. (strain GDMCC 1.1324) TaxID=2138576 RepID=UPI000D34C982|nr:hypothetical protein [Vitiosangium sp. GDMCC 1.1324]PTL82531.1 hypothetical protein DAT35_17140 [Vitiosangium sp. GDMCC 1.1324]